MTTAENDRQGLTKFAISDSAIQKLGTQYMGLTIAGVEDKEGLATVHTARMKMRSHRVEVEKTRKALKEESLAWGRAVDGEARRITGLMAPIEAHLTLEETRVTMAIKAEKERKAAELLEERMEQLKSVESPRHFRDVELMSKEEFSVAYWADHADFETRKDAAAAEAERKAGEDARLAKEKAELDKQRAEQEAESKRITAERIELEAKQAEARKAEDARLQAERERQAEARKVEDARQEAQREELRREKVELSRRAFEAETKEREAAEAKAAEETEAAKVKAAEEAEAAKVKAAEEAEALRIRMAPEVDKVRAIAEQVLAIHVPDISVVGPVLAILSSCSKQLLLIATGLEGQTPNPRN